MLSNLYGPGSCWLWTMLQAIGVVTTLVLIYRQVRIGQHASMLEALTQLEDKWTSSHMEISRIYVCEAYLNATTKGVKAVDHYGNAVLIFFEHLGLLLNLRILDRFVVWERLSYVIINYWQILEPKITEMRATENDDTFYDKFETLMLAMRKIHANKTKASPLKTDAELTRFARDEIMLLKAKLDNGRMCHDDSVPRVDELRSSNKPQTGDGK